MRCAHAIGACTMLVAVRSAVEQALQREARSLEQKCSKGDHIGEMLQTGGEADAAG